MKLVKLFSIVCASGLLGGCVSSHPQNAQEFRDAVPGAFTAAFETYTVNRSFDDVARTFQKKAPECLNVRIKTTSQTNMSYQVIVTKYNPTVHVTNERAELHVQQDHEKGVLNVTKKPERGYYLMVVDAFPAGTNQTKIDVYRPKIGYKHVTHAIRGWATGDNLGCPDLAKI